MKDMGNMMVLYCKSLTREMTIKYLKYVNVDCEGNIEVVWNT